MKKLAMEVDFNKEEDRVAFGLQDRVIRLSRFRNEANEDYFGVSFELSREEDDSIYLTCPYKEFLEKVNALPIED